MFAPFIKSLRERISEEKGKVVVQTRARHSKTGPLMRKKGGHSDSGLDAISESPLSLLMLRLYICA